MKPCFSYNLKIFFFSLKQTCHQEESINVKSLTAFNSCWDVYPQHQGRTPLTGVWEELGGSYRSQRLNICILHSWKNVKESMLTSITPIPRAADEGQMAACTLGTGSRAELYHLDDGSSSDHLSCLFQLDFTALLLLCQQSAP